jgi:hypothetical protein
METLQTHSGLTTALTHLRLGRRTQDHATDMLETSKALEVQADHTSCCDIIPRTQVDDLYSASVAVLVALARGLQTIFTETKSSLRSIHADTEKPSPGPKPIWRSSTSFIDHPWFEVFLIQAGLCRTVSRIPFHSWTLHDSDD